MGLATFEKEDSCLAGIKEMDNMKVQQMEALSTVIEYIDKLVPNMETIIRELRGKRQEDTDEFLNHILIGMNWVIETFNVTMDIINGERVRIDKDEVNSRIIDLGEALKEKDDNRIADILEGDVIPFLKLFKISAEEFV